jgi:glycosyltransferase involved in cell wall biosynthesis
MNPCLLVPIYNHGYAIAGVLRPLADLGLPMLVVDDGSDDATRRALDELGRQWPWLEIARLPENRGRGAALTFGYLRAAERHFSHVVQLDADGQHDPADVPRFLAAARRHPQAMVLGTPIFDESAPTSRVYGRQLSRIIVWAETLSRAIDDPLCGFRCLPLEPTVRLVRSVRLGNRMEFDPELVVRLVWDGVPVINLTTRVRYFQGGLSHFDFVGDNARIAWLYLRLAAQLLPRLVGRVARRAPPVPQ